MNSDTPVYDEEDEEYIAEQIRLREEAEAAGVFNTDAFEDPINRMTDEQIMVLHFAVSSLSQLAKETDSTIGELVQASGFSDADIAKGIRKSVDGVESVKKVGDGMYEVSIT